LKLLLYPLTRKSIKSQKTLQDIQPKLEEIKKTYKDNQEQMAREMMKLYKKHKVNPLSSCFPILIQLPIFIALYRVFIAGLSMKSMDMLYPFITRPESLDTVFLGFINLSDPSIILAVLAGIGQFIQTKMTIVKKQPQVPGSKDESAMALVNKQMMYMMPILTVIIGTKLPGGLTLYWLISTILMIAQQFFIFRKKKNDSNLKKLPQSAK
jgi:YidC/Oxa1 family membrane protein insertase